jgi:hypothetical protein
MKPITPHDPLDDLIAAALHGELSPEERARFESRLQNDPAALAAYLEAQAMHDLLEKTHHNAQPDPDFEQRMVSGVRRKLAQPGHTETAWESLLVFWRGAKALLTSWWKYPIGGLAATVLVALVMAYRHDMAMLRALGDGGIADPAAARTYFPQALYADVLPPTPKDQEKELPSHELSNRGLTLKGFVDASATEQFGGRGTGFGGGDQLLAAGSAYTSGPAVSGGTFALGRTRSLAPMSTVGGPIGGVGGSPNSTPDSASPVFFAAAQQNAAPVAAAAALAPMAPPPPAATSAPAVFADRDEDAGSVDAINAKAAQKKLAPSDAPAVATNNGLLSDTPASIGDNAASKPAPDDSRKLIRNAQLDLEVKSFQAAFDQIGALTKAAGGYVDTSNSQRGGNGKLQGTVVVKIQPQNLDAFLLKLRALGEVRNQSVSTDDVTKDYYDTQARLVNSQKMEVQLQDLLKRENGKVSDLLAVERELGRVRGEIEQMQGQLKLYDFQVQYATVTMNLAEKDLNQTAAYLLKEQDSFSLFATDVEETFTKARQAADSFKAQVLAADLQHNSGSDISASLDVMIAPDQIEPFLAEIRGLGRVANFTRQTQRVAKDGGDSDNPADQTLTEKDKVRVQVSIRSDDDSREQVALTVVTKAVDEALDQAKAAALAHAGVEILSSALNKTPDGASTAQLGVRVPGRQYPAVIDAFRALGRASELAIRRNDNAGPGANGDDTPVIVSLSLTDNDAPVQATNLTIAADDVDAQAQTIKKEAADAGAEVKASSFQHQPDGTEIALMTLRLPLAKYPAFLETLKKAGKVESLSVQRNDRPDQTEADDSAPADIALQIHNPAAIIADDAGLWPTLRKTFGDGFGALFGSVRVIGVLIAFLAPWVVTLVLVAWIARRIYVWRKR